MKKISLLCLFCIITFLCTGCVKYSYNIEIDKNDKVTISETEAMNLSMLKSFDANIEDKIQEEVEKTSEEYKQKGYEVKSYSDDVYNGLTIIKKDIDFDKTIQSLPKNFVSDESNKNVFSKEKKFLKNVYKIHLYSNINAAFENNPEGSFLNGTPQEQVEETSESMDGNKIVSKEKIVDEATGDVIEKTVYENGAVMTSRYNPKEQAQFTDAMGSMVENTPGMMPVAELTIKVPKKPKKHNATKVLSDTEYQWNLVSEKQPVEIVIEYEKYEFATFAMVLSLVLLFLVLAIIFNKTKDGGSLNGF